MNSNGFIFYRGPSQIDGNPIIAIATGIKSKSTNAKTGGMVQTYILRADMPPQAAIDSGADVSICGDCPHRNGPDGRTCYVTIFHGPRAVYSAFTRGLYPEVGPGQIKTACARRGIRFGTYGDPAAVPLKAWQPLVETAAYWTGYTHQWKTADPEYARFCMASVDSESERAAAVAQGWRTFRIRAAGQPTLPREVNCPASKEMGKILQCHECRACNGTATGRRGTIVIAVHGTGANRKAFSAKVAA